MPYIGTLLVAMLPVVLSMGHGSVIALHFDAEQQQELLLTISQSALGLIFLANMEFAWWEGLTMFVLFALQFVWWGADGCRPHSQSSPIRGATMYAINE